MTNFEKLRSMSKEELADKMVADDTDCALYCNAYYCPDEGNNPDCDVTECKKAALRWLDGEVEYE